jgi:hypothetical protein
MMVKRLLESVQVRDNTTNEVYYEIDRLERDELVSTFVEINPIGSDDFLKVKETLTRVGIANRVKKEIYQSCHVLHKKGHYFIVLFKEMFAIDGRETEMTEDDYIRRNYIAKLLENWGLIKIINTDIMYKVVEELPISVYVLPYKDKKQWQLKPKYQIGTIKEGNKNGNK